MKLASLFFLAILGLAAAPAKQFVVISDIHFNPLADPALIQQLTSAEPSQWEPILAGDVPSEVQKYGDDASWPLLSALVRGLQNVQPKPKLIILTGDIFPHKFQEKFVAASGSKDAAGFRSFSMKTFAFVALELQKAAAGIPILYTVGNNDQECGDYALQPHGPFLEDSADSVHALAHLSPNEQTDWSSLGNYVVPNPLAKHHQVFALNTNFWSRRYTNSCGSKTDDPGTEVLAWLSNRLQEARKRRDKVWLVYHIPPGIDGHASSRTNQVVPMWKQSYADGFNKILDQYRTTIELNLAGHTHLDDIRLVKTQHATTLVLINPGVSPNVGQNPAFRIITVDSHARPVDLLTYYMPSFDTFDWKLEYGALEAYGLRHIDARNYQAFYNQLEKSTTASDKWKLNYSVSRPAGLSDKKAYQRSLYCATGNTDTEGFEACLKAAQ